MLVYGLCGEVCECRERVLVCLQCHSALHCTVLRKDAAWLPAWLAGSRSASPASVTKSMEEAKVTQEPTLTPHEIDRMLNETLQVHRSSMIDDDDAKDQPQSHHIADTAMLAMKEGKRILRRISIFETQEFLVAVGGNRAGDYFRVIKIDRSSGVGRKGLVIQEERHLFSTQETKAYLAQLHGMYLNRGGLKLKVRADAMLGIIRIHAHFYLWIVTQKKEVGLIGGKRIYKVQDTELIPIIQYGAARQKITSEELKYKGYFQSVEVNEDFYFSYTYDLTRTLQSNLVKEEEKDSDEPKRFKDQYLWNYYTSGTFLNSCESSYWLVPLIHGYFENRTVKFGSNRVSLTLIARRSRYYAGTRYNKRGISPSGHVANEVETEMIVGLTRPWVEGRGPICSYVMMRGSIPLFWQQTNPVAPKPDITVYRNEQNYETTEEHFQRLKNTYGLPINIINLIKQEERRPQEIVVGEVFESAVAYLGKNLDLNYLAYDFLNRMKDGDDVPDYLYTISKTMVDQIGWFYHPQFPDTFQSLDRKDIDYYQEGIVRVNCIDCLDRTNISQFCLGFAVLGNMLLQLDIIKTLDGWESEAHTFVQTLQEMFVRHGDRIAHQYGGSGTMHKASIQSSEKGSGRFGNAFTAVKRYYSNNFLDVEKQQSMNIFLGNFIPHLHEDPEEEDIDALQDVDMVFPSDKSLFIIPFLPELETQHNFLTYFDELYNPSTYSFFDDDLKIPFNVPIEIDTKFRRASLHAITNKLRQNLSQESTLDETDIKELMHLTPQPRLSESIHDEQKLQVDTTSPRERLNTITSTRSPVSPLFNRKHDSVEDYAAYIDISRLQISGNLEFLGSHQETLAEVSQQLFQLRKMIEGKLDSLQTTLRLEREEHLI